MYKITFPVLTINDFFIDTLSTELVLFEKDGLTCRVIGYNAFPEPVIGKDLQQILCPLNKAKTLVFEYGDFKAEADAKLAVEQFTANIELRLSSNGFAYKNYTPEIMEVGEESRLMIVGKGYVISNVPFSLDKLQSISLDDNAKRAISLLKDANHVSQPSLSFLLHVMAIEALCCDEEKCSDAALSLIRKFENIVNESDCDEKASLACSIHRLENVSCGRKSRELVRKYAKKERYGGKSHVKFIKECYDIRSDYVHSGILPFPKAESFADPLRELVYDVVQGYITDLKRT